PEGCGLEARGKEVVERFPLSGEEKVICDEGVRKVLSELPKGATPADAAVEMARRALLSDPEGNAPAPRSKAPGRKAHGRGPFLVVYHVGRDGKTWVDTQDGRLEVDLETIEEKVRSGARTLKVDDIEGAGEGSAI